MTRVAVICEYSMNTEGRVDLPEGKTWEDVESWYVKWDVFHFKLKGEEVWHECEMNSSADIGSVDWKRPARVDILATDEDGAPDWGEQLAEAS